MHQAITLCRITTPVTATTVPMVVSDLTTTPTHTTATITAVPRIMDTLAIITTPVTSTPPPVTLAHTMSQATTIVVHPAITLLRIITPVPATIAHTMSRATTLGRAITTVAYPATTLL